MAADTSLNSVSIDEDVEISETKINNDGFCRLCAKEGGVISIFDGREDSPPLCEQAMLLAPIKISRDDSLPHLVCCPCSTQLVACYLFRQQCELADRQLRSPQQVRLSTQMLLKQEDLDCEPDSIDNYIDSDKDVSDSGGTCRNNISHSSIFYRTDITESNSRLSTRRFSCGREKKDLKNSCIKDKAHFDGLEGERNNTTEDVYINEKTDFDINSNKDDSRNISTAKDNGSLDSKQNKNKSVNNNDGGNGDLKNVSELKDVTVNIEYDGGDSDTGPAGGDIDYVPGWCDSDEEKLFDTALRLSMVRSTQDWEIKKEPEISNNGDRLENGRVEIDDDTGQQVCRNCGKQTTFIGTKMDDTKRDDNYEASKSHCECTGRRLKRRGRHRQESQPGDAELPAHIGEYASVGTPLLKVREDLYEDRGVAGTPDLISEDQEEVQLGGSKSKKKYHCQFCSETFTAKHLLRKHQRQCTRSKTKAVKSGYTARGLPLKPICGHNGRTFLCSTLTSEDIAHFHNTFYSSSIKTEQDNLLLQFCKPVKTQRRRPKTNVRKPKEITIKYHVKKVDGSFITICSQAFLGILNINKGRVQGVVKRHFTTGQVPTERRGGDRKKHLYAPRRRAVENFIRSRYMGEDSCTIYPTSDVNVKKLFDAYSEQSSPDCSVKLALFRVIFKSFFKTGFKDPLMDACSASYDMELTEFIKLENFEESFE